MGIEYDPAEEEDDETGGVIDLTQSGRWQAWCEAHGLLETARDDSREEHDRMVLVWVRHRGHEHGGTGKPDFTEASMLFENER